MAGEIGSVKIKVGMDISNVRKGEAGIEESMKKAGASVEKAGRAMGKSVSAAMSSAFSDKNAMAFMDNYEKAMEGSAAAARKYISEMESANIASYNAPKLIRKMADAYTEATAAGSEGAETLGKQLKSAEAALKEVSDAGLGPGDAKWDEAYQTVMQLRAETKAYLADLAKTPEQRQREADAIARATARVEAARQKEEEKAEANRRAAEAEEMEAQRLAQIAQNAQVADAKIVAMSNELTALKARQTELTAAGLGPGYSEFDANAAKVRELTAAIREYQAGLGAAKQGTSGLAAAVSRFGGVLGGVLRVLRSVGSVAGGVVKKAAGMAATLGSKLMGAVKGLISSVGKLFDGNKKLTGSMGGMMRSIKRLAPALLAASGVMGIMRKAVDAYMNANVQVANQLSACWSSLGNILGPIIQRLVSLVQTVMAYVLAFLRLLGVTASASTSAMEGAGGAAKKLKQQLSGLDEIHTWQEDNDGSGGGGGTGPDVSLPDVKLPDWTIKLADLIKMDEFYKAGELLAEEVNKLIDKFAEKAPIWGTKIGKAIQHAIEFGLGFIRKLNIEKFGAAVATLIGNALNEINPRDLGAILASGIKSIFRFAHGFLQGYTGPEIGTYLANVVNGWFEEMRRDEGWKKAGQDLNQIILGIITGLENFIKELDTDSIVQDLKDFFGEIDWTGIWEAVKSLAKTAADKVDWSAMIQSLLHFAGDILVFLREEILNIPPKKFSKPWTTLKNKLSTEGETVTWIDILSALADFLGGIVNEIVGLLPEGGWSEIWDNVTQSIADALGVPSWEALKKQFREKVVDVLSAALTEAGNVLYELLKGNHPIMADLLFPEQSAIDKASADFKEKMEESGRDAADAYLMGLADPETGTFTAEMTSAVLSNVVDGFSEATSRYQGILDTEGRAAANSYMSGLVKEGTLTSTEAQWIWQHALDGIVSLTEAYLGELREAGQSAADEWLQGLVDSGAISGEEAQQIIDNAVAALESGKDDFNAVGEGFVYEMSNGMESAAGGMTKSAEVVRAAVRDPFHKLRKDVAGEAAGMESDVSGSFATMAGTVTSENTTMNSDSDSKWSAIKSMMTKSVIDIRTMITSNWDLMKSKVQATNNNISSNVTSKWSAIKNQISSTVSQIKTQSSTAWNAISQSTQRAISEMSSAIQTKMGTLKSTMSNAWSNIQKSTGQAWANIKSTVSNSISSITSSATNWGRDICTKLASGIRSGLSGLASAANSAASTIRSYLHFSLPDKGALTDADSYMPDFMKLLAGGLKKNTPVAARAAAGVAKAIAGEIQNGGHAIKPLALTGDLDKTVNSTGDRIVDGFADVLDRLQALADGISFRMPAVAAGTVIPYSAGVSGMGGGAQYEEETSELIGLLRQFLEGTGSISPSAGSGGEIRTSVQVRGRTLLDVVIEAAKDKRKTTGRNPFTEL